MCWNWPGIDPIGAGSLELLLHEQGRDQVAGPHVGLADQRTERGCAAHAPRPRIREAHGPERTAAEMASRRQGRDRRWSRRSGGTATCRSRIWKPGVDFKEFELSPQIGRVEPFVYPLSDADDERAQRLLRECVCISLHEHCGITPADMRQNDDYIREGREWYGYEGLAASGLDAVFENFLDGTATITSKAGWKWTDAIHDLGMHLADVAHQSTVFVGGTVDDIVEAHRSGRIAMVPCMEGAAMIENELDRLDVLFGLGVRMCGIAYSESNQLGGGVKDPGDGGLTRFGIDAVRRMNRLGMAIDLSHTGDETARQTCEASERSGSRKEAPARGPRPGPRSCEASRRPPVAGRRHAPPRR